MAAYGELNVVLRLLPLGRIRTLSLRCRYVMSLQADTHPYVVSCDYCWAHNRTLCRVIATRHTSVRYVVCLLLDTPPYVVPCGYSSMVVD